MIDHIELEYLLHAETTRKCAAMEKLWNMSHDDTCIGQYLQAWRHGVFKSFEEMLCELACALADEKAKYLEHVVKTSQLAPPAPIVVRDFKTTRE